MPQDAFTIKYLAKELDSILKNAKITKINQPEADEVVLTTYGKEGTKKVVLSANSNLFRCHITKEEKPNPITAPSFCMLLRKHLQGSIILGVDTPTNDRIIQFSILSKNEMQDNENVKLVIELISGLANIILVNKDDVILGSLKKNSIDDEKAKRIIMTGTKYEFPYSNKIAFSNLTKIEHLLNEFKEGNITDYLMNNVAGFAYSTLQELVFRANVSDKIVLTNSDKQLFLSTLENALNVKEKEINPQIVYNNGKPKDFLLFPYNSQSFEKTTPCNTLNDAICRYYSEKDTVLRINEHGKRLSDVIKNNISRSEKKLAAQKEQLSSSENLEKDRLYGELITSYIYKIKRGDEYLLAENYYDTPQTTVKIPLDKNLSPSQNAQVYYKRYNKKKRTIEKVSQQIIETTAHLDMLYNFKANLKQVKNVEELKLIEQDLINAKIISIKKTGKKARKDLPNKPYEYNYKGFNILVGRNSTENEYITHKLGKGKDVWFHVKKAFGSHVLLKYEGEPFPDDVYEICAEIAAYYSENSNAPKTDVDYTEVKNVKKPPSGKLGLVIYNTNYSMTVSPKENKEYRK